LIMWKIDHCDSILVIAKSNPIEKLLCRETGKLNPRKLSLGLMP